MLDQTRSLLMHDFPPIPVVGMHCAGCSGRVERAVAALPGVGSAQVDLGRMTLNVEGAESLTAQSIADAITKAGYAVPHAEHELKIEGMTCAGCAGKVERALNAVPGVLQAQVDVMSGAAHVESIAGTLDDSALVQVVIAAGYRTNLPSQSAPLKANAWVEEASLWACLLVIVLFAINMASEIFAGHPWLPPVVQLLLAVPVVFGIGAPFHAGAFRALRARSANMDVLVSLGTLAAFGLALWQMIHGHAHHLPFEAAALVICFVRLGKWLEARARRATGDAVAALAALRSPSAHVLVDGVEQERAIGDVRAGDIIVVRPGDRIPVDGIIVLGASDIDESLVTGEAAAVMRKIGAPIIGGTLNGAGLLNVRATSVGTTSRLARIVRLVEKAQSSKAPIQQTVDRIAGAFVPAVIALAAITLVGWLIADGDVATALLHAVSVLVVSCPCALGLATPAAVAVGMGAGARSGILVKDARALDRARHIDVVVFDKTGTLTQGIPVVREIVAINGDSNAMLALLASVEQGSEHPIGRVIVAHAHNLGIVLQKIDSFVAYAGQGLKARIGAKTIFAGRAEWLRDLGAESASLLNEKTRAGRTIVAMAVRESGGPLVMQGVVSLSSGEIRPQARETLDALAQRGIKTAVLTGDSAEATHAALAGLGISEIIAGVPPEGKGAHIRTLRDSGRVVAMVGDGINDAPALAEADVGIAMGAGAEAALDAANVALPQDDLRRIVALIDLSRATASKINQNLGIAFAYNVVMIPLAAAGMLSPVAAGAAMALSSLGVVTNALLLRRWRPAI